MAKKQGKQVLVSKPALMARVNRRLARDGQVLRASRSAGSRLDLGDYYIVNVNGNYLEAQHIDLVVLARELGVLKPYERLGPP
jgi:hypothetical protein